MENEKHTDSNGQILFTGAHPGPQTHALECSVPDLCMGGSRGPGKTTYLLIDFAQHAAKYGKNAKGAIFRKKFFPDLQDVIAKANRILVDQLGWTYHGTLHRWTSPEGATLFGYYCETLEQALNYKGHEWTWLGIDEIGDWPDPAPIDFLWGCLRSPAGIPCLRRSTCNPGGPGHSWVKERYVNAGPYKINRWQPQPVEAPHIWIESVFIPSTLDDNPSINKAEYEAALAAVGSRDLFKAWRYGDWDIVAGAFFDIFDPSIHTVKVIPGGGEAKAGEVVIEPWHQRWISMDWGFKDNCVILWHALTENRVTVTYKEVVVNQTTPQQIGEIILQNTGKNEEINAFYVGHDANKTFGARSSPRTISQEIGAVVRSGGLPLPAIADTDRVGGWQLMYQMLCSGNWKISTLCPNLIRSLPELQRDPKKIEDVAESSVDHAPDAARYGLKTHLRSSMVPFEERLARALRDGQQWDPALAGVRYRTLTKNIKRTGLKAFRPKRRFKWAS